MRIAYCTNVRLPSERAHGHQVARVCDALMKLGHEVHIFAPYRRNPIKDDYWSFHKADRKVQLTYLGKFDPIDCHFLPKFFQLFLLNAQLRWCLRCPFPPAPLPALQCGEGFDLLYTRTPARLATLLQANIPVVLELHTLPKRSVHRFVGLCHRCKLIVCLTSPMSDELVRFGVKEEKVIVEPDAVDLEQFQRRGVAGCAPTTLLSNAQEKPIIGYVGQLSSMGLSKGISELLDALLMLRRKGKNVHALIAGPQAADTSLMRRIENEEGVTYRGFVPHEEIPELLEGCDLLVFPAPASTHPFFQRDTSPLKIFEYMAARKPIVAADLPPLRDILSEETAFLCKPGDPKSLADAIERVLQNPQEVEAKAERAWKVVQEHTWEKRMQRILTRLRP